MNTSSITRKKNWLQTSTYFISVTSFGAVSAAFGPVLPDLALQVQTSLGMIGLLFTFRGLGFFLGSLLGGRVYDRLPGHPVLAAAMLLQAVAFALVPLIDDFWLLMFIMVFMGMGGGLLLVGSNTLVVWVHPDNVSPWMNAVSVFSCAGGFLAPIFIAGSLFLTDDLRWAFWSLALLMAVGAVYMLSISSPVIRKREVRQGSDNHINYGLVFLFALVFLLYVGAEVSFKGWIYTITIALHPQAMTSAALLTSVFWGTMAVGRLLAIPISAQVRPRTILIVDFLGALLSLFGVLFLADSLVVLWLGTIIFGLCMASLFPTWMAFADQKMKIDGKINGLFFAGTAVGGMIFPWLSGQMFDVSGPRAAILVILLSLLVAAGIFGAMTGIGHRQKTE
jgi:MFS transporter, FHS family, Na+ dependent glucose transporter 1